MSAPRTAGADAAAVAGNRRRILLLGDPDEDPNWLSPPLCLVRAQIEVFAATSSDIAARTRHQPTLGQVGLRCVHCRPPRRRYQDCAKGAVSYPKSIKIVHQAVRNFQRYHVFDCPCIPPGLKERLGTYEKKKHQSKRDAKHYWVDSFRALGLRDLVSDVTKREEIRFVDEDGGGPLGGGGGSNGPSEQEAAAIAERRMYVSPPPPLSPSEVAAAMAASAAATTASVSPTGSGSGSGSGSASAAAAAATARSVPRADTGKKASAKRRRSKKSNTPIGTADDSNRAEAVDATADGMELAGLDDAFDDIESDSSSLFAGLGLDDEEMRQTSASSVGGVGVGASAVAGGAPSDVSDYRNLPSMRPLHVQGSSGLTAEAAGAGAGGGKGKGRTALSSALALAGLNESFPSACSTNITGSDSGSFAAAPDGTVVSLSDLSRQSSSSSAVSASGSSAAVGPDLFHSIGKNIFGDLPDAPLPDPMVLTGSNIDSRNLLELVRVGLEKTQLFVRTRLMEGSSDSNPGGELRMIGEELYQHFTYGEAVPSVVTPPNSIATVPTGSADSDSELRGGVARKRGRKQDHSAYEILLNNGMPSSVSTMVTSLLKSDRTAVGLPAPPDGFHSIEEVEQNLRLMLTYPSRYLFDDKNTDGSPRAVGELCLDTNTLYGRRKEVMALITTFERAFDSSRTAREAIFIKGRPGIGKSVLIDTIRLPLSRRNGFIISGKFDELRQTQPMSIVFSAFNEFCGDLLQGGESNLTKMRRIIRGALGANYNVLTDLIPNLAQVVGETPTDKDDVDTMNAMHRFFFYFRAFVRCLATTSSPIVLSFDDLHAADSAALELLRTLVADVETSNILFIGCYRDSQVGPDHPIHQEILNLTSAGVNIQTLALSNISEEHMNTLIADTLYLSPFVTRSLSKTVQSKTGGNPLFSLQFLRSLLDEKLLHYSAKSRRWEWDVEQIEAKDVADNVVDLLTEKMLKLSPDAQYLLKVLSCLGSRCEMSTIHALSSDGISNTNPVLEEIITEGFVSRDRAYYKFSHDQVQEAAYALIPSDERESLHLSIGKLLWGKMTGPDLDSCLHTIVDQIGRGIKFMTDHEEKLRFASLCLMAGKKAMASSSFLPAAINLLQGTMMLQDSDWERNDATYNLCLDLTSSCCQAQYASGNYDGVMLSSKPIFLHAKTLQDKMRGHYAIMTSLAAQGKLFDTIKYGLKVLDGLGESLPINPNNLHAIFGFVRTRFMEWKARLIGGVTVDTIANLPEMTDPDKAAAMKLLSILATHSFIVNQGLMGLMIFRQVQLSLSYGICPQSAPAFANFGLVFCATGDYEQGYRYGKLALSLLDKFDSRAKEYISHVYCLVYGFIAIFVEPLQACVPAFQHGNQVGLSVGDIDWALVNAGTYICWAFQAGNKLGPLLDETRTFVQQMKDYKHYSYTVTLPYYQTILNLVCKNSSDPSTLTGEAMDQEVILREAEQSKQLQIIHGVYFFRMWLAFLFRRYDVAAEMVGLIQEVSKSLSLRLMAIVNETWFMGLVALHMSRTTTQDTGRWNSIAKSSIVQMKTWMRNCEWNYSHKYQLLIAEQLYGNGETVAAAKAFDDAISLAESHSFNHDAALAYERASMFYEEFGKQHKAAEYLQKARDAYENWGAVRKVQDINERRNTLYY